MGERPSATEPSSPTAANANVGASALAQASSTALAACPGASRWPSRPTSGRLPAAASPPTTPEAASPTTSSMMMVRLASAFAAKIRRGDRTATSRCRHVPSRSSVAKTSPATREVSSGSIQLQENDRTTNDPAQPGLTHPAAEDRVGRQRALLTDDGHDQRRAEPAGEERQADRPLRQQLDQLEAVAAPSRCRPCVGPR